MKGLINLIYDIKKLINESMYISNLKIKNYRGIGKEVSVDFSSFNTIVGKNDCGKSIIINALNIFFNDSKVAEKDFNFYTEDENEVDRNIFIEVTISDFNPMNLKSFLLEDKTKEDGFLEICEDYVTNNKIVIKKEFKYKKDQKETSSSSYIWVNDYKNEKIHGLKSADLKKIKEKRGVDIPVSGSGKNSDLEIKKYLKIDLEKEEREFSFIEFDFKEMKNILPSVEIFRADQTIETTTSEFKNTFSQEVKQIIRTEKENPGSNILNLENKIREKIKEESEYIKDNMKNHIPDLHDIIITPDFTWEKGVEITKVEVKLNSDTQPIPLENKGSGYRRLFMVARLRYLAEKGGLENIIYLIEEPETFLHPSSQEEMLISLKILSDKNQIFITTHSPIFVGSADKNNITLAEKNIKNITYSQDSSNDFILNIAKSIGVKPSHNILDTNKVIIFVEGTGDIKFYTIAFKKLLNYIIDDNVVAFLPGGGQSLEDFISIKYFKDLEHKQGKKMFLILDSDLGNPDPKKNKQNKALVEKFDLDLSSTGSKGYLLPKRYIESYYNKKSIKRLYPGTDLNDMVNNYFEPEENVEKYLTNKNNPKCSIKVKNNDDIFSDMTEEEWVEVDNTIVTLRSILSDIKDRIN